MIIASFESSIGALRCVGVCWWRSCWQRRPSAHAADLPLLCAAASRRPQAVNWGGLLCRRPGRLRLVRRESDQLAQHRSRAAGIRSTSCRARWGFASWIPGLTGRTSHTRSLGCLRRIQLCNGKTSSSAWKRAMCTATSAATQTRSSHRGERQLPTSLDTRDPPRRRRRSSISDMATFRGRAGYAWGCFLPYVFGGLAVGNADYTKSATVTARSRTPGGPSRRISCPFEPHRRHAQSLRLWLQPPGLGFDYQADRRPVPARGV